MASHQELELPAADSVGHAAVKYTVQEVELDNDAAAGSSQDSGHDGEMSSEDCQSTGTHEQPIEKEPIPDSAVEEEYDEVGEMERLMTTHEEEDEVQVTHDDYELAGEEDQDEGDDDRATASEEDATTEDDDDDDRHEQAPGVPEANGTDITYLVRLTDDGAICLDQGGHVPMDAEPHTYFSISLPTQEVKSVVNPLAPTPATAVSRSRKTKPQALLYNDESDQVVEVHADGSVSSIQPAEHISKPVEGVGLSDGPQGTIDLSEFASQLDSRDIATLETVLQSEQAQALLAHLDLGDPGAHQSSSSVSRGSVEQGPHLWDHSYSSVPMPSPPVATAAAPTINQHSLSGRPKTTISVNYGSEIFKAAAEQSPVPVTSQKATNSSRAKATPPQAASSANRKPDPPSRQGQSTPTTPSPSGSQADKAAAAAAAAAGRRSLRQQDRFERLEAERILAENQEMLLKEKQQLLAAAAGTQISASLSPTGHAHVPVKEQAVTPVTPEQTSKSPQPTSASSGRGGSSSTRPRRENRKLPAHLADPNYVQLEGGDAEMDDGDGKPSRRESEVTNDQESAGDEDVNNEDDDPNKLWCICRRPHNNRFMICCDKCEDWFHGNCVGVTKSQGKVIEEQGRTWICPPCKKKSTKKSDLEEEDKSPTGKGSAKSARKESTGRRRSTSKREPSPDIAISSASSNRKSNPKTSADVTDANANPSDSLTNPAASKSGRRKSEAARATTAAVTATTPKNVSKPGSPTKTTTAAVTIAASPPTLCIVCKAKSARPDSVYCGDQCVVAHSQKSSASAVAASSSAAILTTPKLKRTTSKPEILEEAGNFLAFHVISPGASKSTTVVPARQKELTASALLKQQQLEQQQQQQAQNTPTKPAPVLAKQETQATSASRRKQQTSESSDAKKPSQSQASVSSSTRSSRSDRHDSKPTASSNHKRGHSESTSDNKGTDTRSSRRSSASNPKQSQLSSSASAAASSKKDPDADEAARENFRTSITQAFSTRMQGMSEEELKRIPKKNTAEVMGRAVEEELFIAFGNSTNQKYRNKCRSIVFNLKDLKNSLYLQILSESLKPKELARMDAHQLASAELTEWRLQEQKKELEIIQRAELEKLQEARRQELIDSGAEIEKVVQVAPISTDISDLIEETEDGTGLVKKGTVAEEATGTSKDKSTKKDERHSHSRHKSSSSSTTDKDKSKSSSSDRKDRDKDKDRHSSSRHSSSSGKDKDKDKEHHHRRSERHSHRKESSESSSATSSDTKDKSKHSAKDKDKKDTKKEESKDKSHHHTRRSERHKSESSKSSSTNKEEAAKPSSSIEKKEKAKPEVVVAPPPTKKSKAIDLYESIAESVEKSGAAAAKTGPPSISSLDDLSRTSFTNEDASVSSGSVSITGEKPESRGRWSIDSSEQELPSSTIKTPEFEMQSGIRSSESSGKKEDRPVLKSKFVMPELGQFNAALFNVSHTRVSGLFFPTSPVPIVGRIGPDTVWDYIDKMKKSKELIVFRLAPATPADAEAYMSFFTYFSSRGRLGVLGGIHSPLKDVYLVPLDKHSPVNRVLLPFRGPGLPKDRPHCLLAVVTRHEAVMPASIPSKRKPSPPELLRIDPKKKFKPGDSSSSSTHHSSSRSTRRTSAVDVKVREQIMLPTTTSEESGKAGKSKPEEVIAMDTTETEDDKPYEPWEEDDDDVPPISGSGPGLTTNSSIPEVTLKPPAAKEANCELLLAQLDAQIRSEQLAIQSIASSLVSTSSSMKAESTIPGLDGEFSPIEGTSAPAKPAVPFFLQSPPQIQQPAVVKGVEPVFHDIDERITTSNLATPAVPDEAPYSPSALEFTSDDEENSSSRALKPSSSSKTSAPPVVVSLDSSPSSDDEPKAVGVVMGSANARRPPGFQPITTTELEQEQSTGQAWSIPPFRVGAQPATNRPGNKININLINPTNK